MEFQVEKCARFTPRCGARKMFLSIIFSRDDPPRYQPKKILFSKCLKISFHCRNCQGDFVQKKPFPLFRKKQASFQLLNFRTFSTTLQGWYVHFRGLSKIRSHSFVAVKMPDLLETPSNLIFSSERTFDRTKPFFLFFF